MTPVRMAHPNHGFMHAYTADEIKNLEALGWKAETPSPLVALNETLKAAQTQPLSEPKKRGRPAKVKHGDGADAR